MDDPGVEQWTRDLPDPVERDWADVIANDTLTALLTFNSTSYFLYRGEAMGYEFRALREFADAHDLVLDATVVRNRTELFRLLNEGEGDVVGARLVPIREFQEVVGLTRPLYDTRPTVVQQREPLDSAPIPDEVTELVDSAVEGPTDDPPAEELRARLVEHPRELAGDTVTLPRGSEYYRRLVELRDTMDETIELVELENVMTSEGVMQRIAAGTLDITVTPENLAELSTEYFTNLAVEPVVGPRHGVVWAVRSNAPVLRDSLNAWIERERDGTLSDLYDRYFIDRRAYRERAESEYLTSETGRLSEHDSLLAAHAREIGWDWRLLASQAFQESRFDADARSWAGAMGLLQLMPGTARDMGVSDPHDPVQNVEGAVKYIAFLEERWTPSMPDSAARLPFVLASYNAGFGHVEDAQRIAEKNGDDPASWEDVAFWLLRLSQRRWYSDPVVRFGYVRGLEPVTYVSLIRERYDHYLDFVAESPALSEDPPPLPDTTRERGDADVGDEVTDGT